jgi:hypothetical protein
LNIERRTPSSSFACKKKAALSALYYEHLPEKDPLYIDERGIAIPYTPDWAVLLDDQVCLVELKRDTLREQLYFAIKHERFYQFRKLRKELLSTILRHQIAILRHRHVEGSPLPFLVAKPQLREGLSLPKGDDWKIPDSTLLDHLYDSTEKYIAYIVDLLNYLLPDEADFLKHVIDELEELSSHTTEKMTDHQLLEVVQVVIQNQREACNFQDDLFTLINSLRRLHLKASCYADNTRLDTRKILPMKKR